MDATTVAGQQLWFLDTLVTLHARHDDGRDGVSLIESRAPYGDSPPLHVHHTEDEVFHLLDGELRLHAGDEDMWLRPGETLVAPKGVAHTYRVESPGGARWLIVTTHGDFEHFLREMSRPAEHGELPAPAGPPTPEQADALAVLAGAHGIEFVGPPLGPYTDD